jgi:hypothetical protein
MSLIVGRIAPLQADPAFPRLAGTERVQITREGESRKQWNGRPGQSGIECARVESARPTTANEESVQNEDYDDRHRSSKERTAGSRGG